MSLIATARENAGFVERLIYDAIEYGGLPLVTLIVFAECGLLVGFFLPGDSLLFICGFLSSDPGGGLPSFPPLPVVLACLFPAAVLGDQLGYWIGHKIGPSLFTKPDSRLFKQQYVVRTQAFFDKHGPKAIVIARFVPIVRTFMPVMAGVGKMRYRSFLAFNVVGGLLWAVGVTTGGYFLGQIEVIRDNIEIALVLVVLISLAPPFLEYLSHRRQARVGS